MNGRAALSIRICTGCLATLHGATLFASPMHSALLPTVRHEQCARHLIVPSRKATYGLVDFIKEQANTLAQYEELITGGDVETPTRLEPRNVWPRHSGFRITPARVSGTR